MTLWHHVFFTFFVAFIITTPSRLCSQDLSNTTRGFHIQYYDLSITPDISSQHIKGSNKIHIISESRLSVIELDLSSDLSIDSILLNENPVAFRHTSNKIFIYPQPVISAGQNILVHIFYQGHPVVSTAPPWDGGIIWASDNLSRPWIGVACQNIGASSWWPCNDHWSSEADSMQFSILTDSSLIAVANGVLTRIEVLGAKRLYTWKVSYPINNYCVSFTIGSFRHFSDTLSYSNTGILPCDYYVLDYNYSKATKHFRQARQIIQTFEDLFGPYPFKDDGYKLVETPYWGMEHQSAIAYGNNYVNNFFELDYIIVHETAHEWWGNSLTAKDKSDMWLHEAFATYAEVLLLEEIYGYTTGKQHLLKQKGKIKNAYPIAAPVSDSSLKDTDQYYKGSWMLHTIRYMIDNDSVWFSSLKKLQQQFACQTVTRNEFIEAWSILLGQDITPVISHYLDKKEPPALLWQLRKGKKKQYLYLKWEASSPSFSLPVVLSYDDKKIRVRELSGSRFTKIVLPLHAEDIKLNSDDFLFTLRRLQQ